MSGPMFELIAWDAKGQTLHGLRSVTSEGAPTAIHVHGTWGNFYANPFIVPLAATYAKNGLNYITANFPGHDETAQTENFGDFENALHGLVEKFAPRGGLLLQGHSLGALKILNYLDSASAALKDRVAAVVLLSPFDIVAFYAGGKAEGVQPTLDALRRLVAAGKGADFVPQNLFSYWPITVNTMIALMTPGGPADVFPSRTSLKDSPITRLRNPALVALGGDDFAAFPSPGAVRDQVNATTKAESVLVTGAPHNFAGRVEELSRAVNEWLQSSVKLR